MLAVVCSMMCNFERCGEKNGKPVCCCSLCGRKAYSKEPESCHASCRNEAYRPVRNDKPGDAIEELLTSYGITKEWWQDYKSKHGLPPTCGCDSRRQYLNDLAKAHPTLAQYGVMVFRALTRKRT